MRKRTKRGSCTPSPRKMKDWNLYEQAYLDLLESVVNYGTQKSMGKETNSMRFWEKFALRLSESQQITVNADDCLDQLEYLEILYNQLKWEPEPKQGSYLQLCGPEFRQQLLNIFDKFTIKLPSDRTISRWKNRRNRSEQTCSSMGTTGSRSGLGSNSVPGGGVLVKASDGGDWEDRVAEVVNNLIAENKMSITDFVQVDDILFGCKKKAERFLRCESTEQMLMVIQKTLKSLRTRKQKP